ncbi:MAG: hypothetical protein IJ443_06330, partial [Firmicutes bacterium]|nr:hypothetical protein [Bacillota bacterium]
LLLVETIDGEQFEDLFTGKFTAEELAENVKLSHAKKKEQDAEEAAERERLRKEEEAKLEEELKKYDGDYMADGEPAEPKKPQAAAPADEARAGRRIVTLNGSGKASLSDVPKAPEESAAPKDPTVPEESAAPAEPEAPEEPEAPAEAAESAVCTEEVPAESQETER